MSQWERGQERVSVCLFVTLCVCVCVCVLIKRIFILHVGQQHVEVHAAWPQPIVHSTEMCAHQDHL